jgi:hypothetical protein
MSVGTLGSFIQIMQCPYCEVVGGWAQSVAGSVSSVLRGIAVTPDAG